MSLDLAILCRIATYRKELGRALRNTEKILKRPDAVPPSPNGDTPFLRKGASALRHAAPVTQEEIP